VWPVVEMIVWFDDLDLSSRCRGGAIKVTRDHIERFAAEFDPQPFRLDEVDAEKSILNGLAASGWHTAALAMRLIVSVRPFGSSPVVGLGGDDLRWLAPVRLDDVLRVEGEVVEFTPSRTKPQGTVRVRSERRRGPEIYTYRRRSAAPGVSVIAKEIPRRR
jgi:acyl dehydratase